MKDIAKALVDVSWNMPEIAARAGQPDKELISYHNGYLEVPGVTQEALEAAVASFDNTADERKRLAGLIAARRYTAETAGITVFGVPVYTDRTTQNKLTGAALRASRDSSYTVDWKCSNNTFVSLTAEQIVSVADAVGDHVQACYSREADLLEAVADGSYTDPMLEEGWPV